MSAAPCNWLPPDRTPTLPLRLIQVPCLLRASGALGVVALSSTHLLLAQDLYNCQQRLSPLVLDCAPSANRSRYASITYGTADSSPSLSTPCYLPGSGWGPPPEASRARYIGFSASKLLMPLQRGPHTRLWLMIARWTLVSSNTK